MVVEGFFLGAYESVFGVADGVDDGVENHDAFGEQSCQRGDQRRDDVSLSQSPVQDDDDVGRPQSHPYGDVDQIDFGEVNVEAAGPGNFIVAQRYGVHLDDLSAKVGLAFGSRSDDVEVAEEDDQQREAVVDAEHGERVSDGLRKTKQNCYFLRIDQ